MEISDTLKNSSLPRQQKKNIAKILNTLAKRCLSNSESSSLISEPEITNSYPSSTSSNPSVANTNTTTSISTSQISNTNNSSINGQPFLYRTHLGYKILSNGGTRNDLKKAVSIETKIQRFYANDDQGSDSSESDCENEKPFIDGNITYNMSQHVKEKIFHESQHLWHGTNIDFRSKLKIKNLKLFAHKKGTKIFECLFCSKILPALNVLKFHLEFSHPSFTFKYTSSSIKISSEINSSIVDKISSGKIFFEQLYKNSLSLQNMQEDNELGNNDRQKRLGYFPSRINSIYTEVRARPGLYGHDVALKEILHFKFLDNLNLTECEKGFYTLWNNFNAERSNRDYGTMALYKKLLKFIEKYYDTIVKMKLKTVWNVFLIYFKNNNIITEMEFFELSFFHRPPLKNKIAWK